MKAFPVASYVNASGETWDSTIQGMDLRDYFAAKAMLGIVDSSVDAGLETIEIAESAYRIADAMMEVRKQWAENDE